ncbi:MAG: hypothetical protein OHK0021_01810 [Bryobacter sp.]
MQRFGEIEVDARTLTVRKAGALVELEPKAIRVLLYLMAHRDRVVGKEELFAKVWSGAEVTDNALTRIIGQLRKGLGDDARQAKYIETVPTVGYRFIAQEDSQPAQAPAKWNRQAATVAFVAALVVALGGILLLWLQRPAPRVSEESPPSKLRQLTNSRGLDTGPTLSPDGKWLAYSSDRGGQFEIYMRAMDGVGAEVQITKDGGPNLQAAWSPDGKWIAYHCVARGGLCVIPATGGAARLLHVPASEPAWSPDSKRIVFREVPATTTSPLDLFGLLPRALSIVDIESGKLERLPAKLANLSMPQWSREGKHIVYFVGPDLDADRIEAWEVSTGKREVLVRTKGLSSALALSTQQDRLYYTEFSKAEGSRVMELELSESDLKPRSQPRVVFRADSLPTALALSADGKHLVLGGVVQDSNLFRVAIKPDGSSEGEPIPLTANRNFRNTSPRISPDGKKIVYVARQVGTPAQVWLADFDGSNAERISGESSSTNQPVWTQDGKAVIYRKSGNQGLERVDLEKRTRQAIRIAAPSLSQYSYAGTGDWAMMHEFAQEKLRMALLDFRKGTREEIRSDLDNLAFGFLSPDGKRIAAERFENGFTHLTIVDRESGKAKQWGSGPEQAWVYSWSPDGRRIAMAAQKQGVWNVYSVDADTGIETKLTNYQSLRYFVRYPDWSRQGNWMVFELTETTGNLYELQLADH